MFEGNFRQILPIYTQGYRKKKVFFTLNSFYLWDSCKLMILLLNSQRRWRSYGHWKSWGGINWHTKRIIDWKCRWYNFCNYWKQILKFVASFGGIKLFHERVILIPKLDHNIILMIQREGKIYLSNNNVWKAYLYYNFMDVLYITKFLNIMKLFSMPYH